MQNTSRYPIFRNGFIHCLFLVIMLSGFAGLYSQNSQDQQSSFVAALFPGRIEWNPLYTYTSTEAQLYTAVYEGLVVYDPRTLQPIPGVAESWTISDDGLTYTFTLRSQAQYHDGSRVTPQDFKDTWIHMLNAGNLSPFGFLLDSIQGAREWRNNQNRNPDNLGIYVKDSNTLVLQLAQPAPHFMSILAHQSLVPVHGNYRNTRRWTLTDSIPSNGPFLVESRTHNRIELIKNPSYWDSQNVSLSKITLLLRDDPVQNARDYNAGTIDWILSSFDTSELRVPGSLQMGSQFATSYLFFNSSENGIPNSLVRTALASFIPKDNIRSPDVYFVPTERLVPDILGYPVPEKPENLSKEQAMEILSEQGYPQGIGLPSLSLVFPAGDEPRRIGQLISMAWSENLEVEVESTYLDFELLQEVQNSGEFTLSMISWIGDYADPLTFLELWKRDNPINLGGHDNSEFEALLEKSASFTGEERYALLSEAESVLLKTGAVIPISHSPSINVIDLSEIDGWYINPLDIHPFKNIRFIGQRAPSNVVMQPIGNAAF